MGVFTVTDLCQQVTEDIDLDTGETIYLYCPSHARMFYEGGRFCMTHARENEYRKAIINTRDNRED
jgi:hypothetical protein